MNDLPSQVDDPGALFFVSLGGAGEIGMNLNLYGYAGDWLILDCGVTFSDDAYPGIYTGSWIGSSPYVSFFRFVGAVLGSMPPGESD